METKTLNIAAGGKPGGMKKISTTFLQGIVILVAIVAVFAMVQFPLMEGRATNLGLFEVYTDPLILYGYAASTPFFIGLFKAFKLLGYIGQNNTFSPYALKAIRMMKHCSIALGGLIVIAAVSVMIFHDKTDDAAGFLALCIGATFVSGVVATALVVFEKIVRGGIALASGNQSESLNN